MKKLPFDLIAVLLVYLLSFFLVPPFYEHPIGDAWSFAIVAKHFYETGEFRPIPWFGETLLFQIGWAFLFLFPFGFSFSTLHLSSAVMGIWVILFFNLLMGSLGFGKRERFWGGLLLTISPPFIFLSRTFYSDLTFLALYLAAAWAYAKAISLRSARWLLVGTLFLGLSILVRQIGIFLPFILFFVLQRDHHHWRLWQKLSLFIPCVIMAFFAMWQRHYFHGLPPWNLLWATYALRFDQVVFNLLWTPYVSFLYLGYYASPLLIPCAFECWRERHSHPTRWLFFLWSGIAFGIAILCFGLGKGLWMPAYLPKGFNLMGATSFWYTVITLCSLVSVAVFSAVYYPHGVRSLDQKRMGEALLVLGVAICGLSLPPVRSGLLSLGTLFFPFLYHFFSEKIHLYKSLEVWQAELPAVYHQFLLGLFMIFGIGAILFWLTPHFLKKRKKEPFLEPIGKAERFFHQASLSCLFFPLFFAVTTDRYFFPVFPSAILLTLRAARSFPYRKVFSCLLVFCVFIPSLLHTDRTIQRVGALWEGGNSLLNQGIPADHIDAGFVFNGWHLYEKRQKEGFEGTDKGWREEGWWVKEAVYRVSPSVSEGYRILRQIPYRDLLTPSGDVVYVTRRK